MSKKLIDRKCLAAAFFAAAAQKLLPDVQFIESGYDQLGFYYDFYLPYAFSENLLAELERTANQISEKAKISFKEMLPENAKNYLEHLGQFKRKIKTNSTLVDLIKIDQFTDFIPSCGTVVDKRNFFIKLYKLLSVDQSIYRVYGFVFENSKECFKFLKTFKDYEKHNALSVGKKRKWFDLVENQLFFYPKGVIFKNKILKLIFDELIKLGFKPIQSHPINHADILRITESDLTKVFEIVFSKNFDISEEDPFNSQINIFIKQTILILKGEFGAECISYLQSIIKMLNILGFRYEFELCTSSSAKLKKRGKVFEEALLSLNLNYELQDSDTWNECELKVFAKDKIGRKWGISSFRLNEDTIESSFCSSLNRWIALLAESDKAYFRILPEHVRVIPVEKKYIDYAEDIKSTIQANGFNVDIDTSEKPLDKKVFNAKIQDVPFVAVVGEKELKSKTIALRLENESKINLVKLCELLEKLKQKEKIEN